MYISLLFFGVEIYVNFKISKMFKKPKQGNDWDKDISQHIVRHTMVLKDIAQRCDEYDAEMMSQKLKECAHLLSKRCSIYLDGNNEDYHDYIQDFYDSQMQGFRKQIYTLQNEVKNREREIQSLVYDNKILQENHNLINVREPFNDRIEEKIRLKKQLDHCTELLQENNCLIEEQNFTIEQLTNKLSLKERKLNQSRREYEERIVILDQLIKTNSDKFNRQYRMLQSDSREMGQHIKQSSISTLRAIEEKQMIEKEFYLKMQELKLLTKKVYEQSLVIAKIQRQLGIRDTLIEQFNTEITRYEKLQEGISSKEEKVRKQELEKRMQRQQLMMKINKLQNKCMEHSEQIVKKANANKQLQANYNKLRKQYEESKMKVENIENEIYSIEQKKGRQGNQILRLQNENSKLIKQIKLGEERYNCMRQTHSLQKQKIKNDIMVQVQQLATLNAQQQAQLYNVKELLQQQKCKTSALTNNNNELQHRYDKMSEGMDEIKHNICRIQEQKNDLQKVKTILYEQLEKYKSEEDGHKLTQQELCALREQNEGIRGENLQYKRKITQYQQYIQALSNKVQEAMNNRNSQTIQNNQHLMKQIKRLKEQLVKRDFHIKQLESKLKILQEEVRNSDKLYENQKIKMNIKIRELQELLKQRYDYTGRLSQPASSK